MTDQPEEHDASVEPDADLGAAVADVEPDAELPDETFPEETLSEGPSAEESFPEESFGGDVLEDDVLEDGLLDDGPAPRAVATGHPAVDEVLRSLDGLDGRPVDEHVAAFEQAHEVLRRALSNAADDPVTRPEG
jgi:hypothetical protein